MLQPVYKLLPPEDIVRLKANDELFVVIPALNKTTDKDVLLILCKYYLLFQRIIDKSNRRINPDDRDWYVKQVIANDHKFRQDGMIYVEYAVRVRNYAEREHFERDHFDSRIVDTYWRQGAGINVVVCGYTMQQSVLIELRDVGYLQIYMKTSSDAFLSDRIGFSNNVRSATTLIRPFVKQLSLFDGCWFGTLEILWKYYRSITNSNQPRHRVIQSQLAVAQATMCVSNGMQDTDVPLFDDTFVRLELSDENIETFVSVVETAYKISFQSQYIGFSVVGDYLVERKYLRTMYNSLIDLFPFVHSVLAMTVSLPRARGNRVDVSSFFDGGNAKDDNVTNDETSEEQKCNDEDMSDALSTKQWWATRPPRNCGEYQSHVKDFLARQ